MQNKCVSFGNKAVSLKHVKNKQKLKATSMPTISIRQRTKICFEYLYSCPPPPLPLICLQTASQLFVYMTTADVQLFVIMLQLLKSTHFCPI